MRTTLILDDDVEAKLRAEARRSGRSFRGVVNETLRRGLANRRATSSREPFLTAVRDLGNLLPGLDLDRIADLIDQAEGPLHR